MAKAKEGSKFVVEFRGMKLPADVEKKISSEIQQAVLRQVASLDLFGNFNVTIPGLRPVPIWRGIVFRPVEAPIEEAPE